MLKLFARFIRPARPARPARVDEPATVRYLRLAARAAKARETEVAMFWLRVALGNANRENDPLGKRHCMRLINRLRSIQAKQENARRDARLAFRFGGAE
jgi:hypothetical protein